MGGGNTIVEMLMMSYGNGPHGILKKESAVNFTCAFARLRSAKYLYFLYADAAPYLLVSFGNSQIFFSGNQTIFGNLDHKFL